MDSSGAALHAYRQDLVQQRSPIIERYQKWKARADEFNQKYAGHEFDEDSKEAKDGVIEQAWLSREGQDYQRLANAFNVKVGKLTELLRLHAESEKIRKEAEAPTPTS